MKNKKIKKKLVNKIIGFKTHRAHHQISEKKFYH